MQFGYTILYVENVAETLAFYEAAFGMARRMLHDSGDYGELETGATTLAFADRAFIARSGKSPQAADPAAPVGEIALVCDDVAQALQRACKAGASEIQPLRKMPWGQEIAYVADPNGFLVEICTPVGG